MVDVTASHRDQQLRQQQKSGTQDRIKEISRRRSPNNGGGIKDIVEPKPEDSPFARVEKCLHIKPSFVKGIHQVGEEVKKNLGAEGARVPCVTRRWENDRMRGKEGTI